MRCQNHPMFKRAIYFLMTYAVFTAGFARAGDVFKGTYFVVLAEPDYVVVAIDSRLTTFGAGEPTYRDNYCKILILEESTIFFSEGLHAADGPLGFNGYHVAKSKFEQ